MSIQLLMNNYKQLWRFCGVFVAFLDEKENHKK